MIVRMPLFALAFGFLSACGRDHVDDENFLIKYDQSPVEYAIPNDSHLVRMRCTSAHSDAECGALTTSECQELGLGFTRGRHLWSQRTNWPEWARGPLHWRADASDWMWIVLCES